MISHDIHPPIPILRWSSWVSWDDDLPGTWRRGKVWLPPASMKRVPSIAPRIGFGTNGLAFLFFRWIRVNSGFYIWLVVTGTWLDSDFPETVGNGNSSQLTHFSEGYGSTTNQWWFILVDQFGFLFGQVRIFMMINMISTYIWNHMNMYEHAIRLCNVYLLVIKHGHGKFPIYRWFSKFQWPFTGMSQPAIFHYRRLYPNSHPCYCQY